jgi:hypothetical protein
LSVKSSAIIISHFQFLVVSSIQELLELLELLFESFEGLLESFEGLLESFEDLPESFEVLFESIEDNQINLIVLTAHSSI